MCKSATTGSMAPSRGLPYTPAPFAMDYFIDAPWRDTKVSTKLVLANAHRLEELFE